MENEVIIRRLEALEEDMCLLKEAHKHVIDFEKVRQPSSSDLLCCAGVLVGFMDSGISDKRSAQCRRVADWLFAKGKEKESK